MIRYLHELPLTPTIWCPRCSPWRGPVPFYHQHWGRAEKVAHPTIMGKV